jgi:hypothetical protein
MKDLKAKYFDYINESEILPVLDDNDEYFNQFTAEEKLGYMFIVLKKALSVFLKEKELNKIQTEKILDLENRIKQLEKK